MEEGEVRAMKQDLFQCQACGGTFEKGCTDEEALEEMKKKLRRPSRRKSVFYL